MDLEEATLRNIVDELRTRPVEFVFVAGERMREGRAILAFSGKRTDAIDLIEWSHEFLRSQPDDGETEY